MMQKSEQLVIQQTTQWIQSFVIQFNLCPFAKREMDKGSARFQVSSAKTPDEARVSLIDEVHLLDTNPDIETTLLIFPFCLNDFFEYLDVVDRAHSDLFIGGYEGIYQLASFHPNYCFADASVDDVTNYTNRSPFPMLHILREESVERAIAYYGNTEEIPENNMAKLREMGLGSVKKLFQQFDRLAGTR